ncbi:hypothetical protein LLG95_01330 [bacterium]|nr:hypothetical protein [bacterium]
MGPILVLEIPIEIAITAHEDLADYEFLGYDPVSRSTDAEFDHSPLSCNYGYQKYKVNGHCLLDNFEEAWRITTEIARDAVSNKDWEPGPYFLCAVYRKRKSMSV